jgi:DNA-binding transcriptional regulator of glucitol operon
VSSVVLLIAWVLEIVLVGWSVRHHLRVSQQRVQNASQHEQEQGVVFY